MILALVNVGGGDLKKNEGISAVSVRNYYFVKKEL